jgi:hypothetical protein
MKKYIWIIVFALIALLIPSYQFFSSKIPMSDDDEEGWISDSYFTQFYINGDFRPDVWNNTTAMNQPMLAQFAFGLWLYPKYLSQKQVEPNLDYTKFLIEHGFDDVDGGLPEYASFKNSIQGEFTTLRGNGAGFPDELVAKLGKNILKTTELIQSVRILNSLLLASSVVLLFTLFYKPKRLLFSLIFTFAYAYNSLILNWGLMAHSEALFLLLFNCSIYFLYKYFFQSDTTKNLLFFSVFMGLCFSTKLNGIMLYFVFLILTLVMPGFGNKNRPCGFLRIILPIIISLAIFTILNPYTYSSPILNTFNMFVLREETARWQMIAFPYVALPGLVSRVGFIANSFANNFFFLSGEMTSNYFYKIIIAVLFFTGVFFEIRNIIKKDKFSLFIFSAFVITFAVTASYLQLAWPRYLIQLVLFFVYYEITGLLVLSRGVKRINRIF